MLSLSHLKGLVRGAPASRTVPQSKSNATRRVARPTASKSLSRNCASTARSEEDIPSSSTEASSAQTLGNIYRHTAKDHFDWGAIKERVFGEFGKRPSQTPIRRLSFVPEPTADEEIIPKIHIPEPLGGFSDYAPTKSGWYIPLVPKPRPILRDGNTVTGMGRRKRAVANVKMTPGAGNITINGRHWMYYFKDAPVRNSVLEPLTLTEYLNKWDIEALVSGGGFRGQAGAMRLAISRALLHWDPELQPPLKRAGYLTRDKREVERKKPGKRKARRSFQWVKR